MRKYRFSLPRRAGLAISLAVLAAAALTRPATAQQVPDPGNYVFLQNNAALTYVHSYLVGYNPSANGVVWDTQFNQWIGNALDPAGVAKIADAQFFFQECFGGGMIAALPSALPGIPWVAGSASTYAQTALATPAPAFGVQPQYASWSYPLVGKLYNQITAGGTTLAADKYAYANDFYGPNGYVYRETPQYASYNGGNALTLSDPAVNTHYAVIFVGDTSSLNQSMINVTADMLTTLTTAWAGQDFSIKVLFGNGGTGAGGSANVTTFAGKNLATGLANFNANNNNPNESISILPGTPTQLQNTLNTLGNTNQDQFVFFGFDHGGKFRTSNPKRNAIPGLSLGGIPTPPSWSDSFSLEDPNNSDPNPFPNGELMDSDTEEDPTAPPTITITYTGLDTNAIGTVDVLVNGFDIGALDDTNTTTTLPIPLTDLMDDNALLINDNSGENITILTDVFDSGALPPLEDTLDAPEPSSLAALLVLLSGAALTRRKTRNI